MVTNLIELLNTPLLFIFPIEEGTNPYLAIDPKSLELQIINPFIPLHTAAHKAIISKRKAHLPRTCITALPAAQSNVTASEGEKANAVMIFKRLYINVPINNDTIATNEAFFLENLNSFDSCGIASNPIKAKGVIENTLAIPPKSNL